MNDKPEYRIEVSVSLQNNSWMCLSDSYQSLEEARSALSKKKAMSPSELFRIIEVRYLPFI